MKAYVLTCINGDNSVVSNELFATIEDAHKRMVFECEQESKHSQANSVKCNRLVCTWDAEVDFGAYSYKWEVRTVDIDSSLFADIARNLFFIFRDYLSSNNRRLPCLFKAIFGEVGEHIYNTKWRDDRPYDFICSLDKGNIAKFADFLVNPYKYRDIAAFIARNGD